MRTNKAENVIAVIGGGGHAKVVINILRKLRKYRILGYTDPTDNGALLTVPYLGSDDDLIVLTATEGNLNAALGVGQVGLGQPRYELWSRLRSAALAFPSVVSPAAIVNEDVCMGEACVVMDGAVINTGVRMGDGVIVNTNSTIEHDVRLQQWVHVAPGATISGGVVVGRFSMIGTGATVIEGITVAPNCLVGAGATVVDDLTESGVYVGTPARRIR